jgi:hypothetical protein
MKAIQFFTAIGVIAGALLGPGQVIWCLFLSGSAGASYKCEPDQEISISLSPDQSPVRLLARIEYRKPRLHIGIGPPRTSFKGVLSRDDKQLWSDTFGVTVGDDEKTGVFGLSSSYSTSSLQVFMVDTAGDYQFIAKSTRSDDIEILSLTLKVRQNVTEVDLITAITGFALLLLAFAFGMTKARATRRNSKRKSRPTRLSRDGEVH